MQANSLWSFREGSLVSLTLDFLLLYLIIRFLFSCWWGICFLADICEVQRFLSSPGCLSNKGLYCGVWISSLQPLPALRWAAHTPVCSEQVFRDRQELCWLCPELVHTSITYTLYLQVQSPGRGLSPCPSCQIIQIWQNQYGKRLGWCHVLKSYFK